MRKFLSPVIVSFLWLQLMAVWMMPTVNAVSYPVWVPSWEVIWGTFNTYFSNMFGVGITDTVPNYLMGCPSWEVMRWLSNTGILLCVSPGLNVTSSATLSLSGSLIGTLNYVAKYNNLAGTGINISQIYDNGTNVGIATSSPTYKLDVAGTWSFYGLRVASGAMNGYVLTSDAAGIATWKIAPTPCVPAWVGADNTCYWVNSLQSNNIWDLNTANGVSSLYTNTNWSYNSSFWAESLYSNLTGLFNTANWYQSLYFNQNWNLNTAIGSRSLYFNQNWNLNIAVWYSSLSNLSSWDENTALGNLALFNLLNWNLNISIWKSAWGNLFSGGNNIAVWNNTNFINTAWSNQLNIANIIFGTGLTGTVGTPAGNVGIGTANPTAKLEVAWQIKITGGIPWVWKTLTSDATGLATWTDTVSGSTATGIVAWVGAQNYIPKFGSGWIGIYASQLYDDATNVGIGTITPGAKLEVSGQVKITGGSPWINKVLSSDASGLASWVSLSSVSGVWSVLGNSGTVAGTNFVGTTDNNDLVFKTNNLEAARILAWGNVGFGTATPGAKLEVAWQIKITGGVPWAGKVLTSDAAGLASWTTAPSPCIPTGIGTDNTCYGINALQLNTSGIYNTANWFNSLFANTTWNYNTAYGYMTLRSNTWGSSNTAIGQMTLADNSMGSANTAVGFNSLRLNTTGNLNTALGTISMQSNISGNWNTANWWNSLANNTTGSNNTAIGYNTALGLVTGSANTIIGANVIWLASGLSNNIIIADGNGNQRINVDATGNIGIGTTTPWSKLEVAGQIKITGGVPWLGKILISDATGLASWSNAPTLVNTWNIVGNSGTVAGTNFLGTTDNNDLVFKTNSVEFMRALASGNVGIGTTTPWSKLEVAWQIKITGGTPGLGKILTSDATGLATWSNTPTLTNTWNIIGNSGTVAGTNFLGTTDAIDLVFKRNNIEWFRLSGASGNLVTIADATINGMTIGRGGGNIGFNTAIGFSVLQNNTTGSNNTANWIWSLLANNAGSYNTANGWYSLFNNTTGNYNTANGQNSLYDNSTGSNNTALGYNTARGITTGSGNTILGANVTALASNLSNNIIIADGNGNQRINVIATGDMGIGTATPGAKLEVAGQVRIATAGAYLDYRPNAVSCTNWQILSWNNASTRWECSSNAPGISGSWLTTNYLTKWNGAILSNSQLFDNGTNVGIGTATPWSKLEVAGKSYFNGDVTVSGSLIVDKIVNRTVNNVSISWSLLPDSVAPLIYRDIGSTSQKWNNLYLSGQISIAWGIPGLWKILTSDATGLAIWSSSVSGSTATGITGGTQNYIPKFGTGWTGLYLSQLFDNGANIGIGTTAPTSKLTIDSGIAGSAWLRLSRISATTTPFAGINTWLGVDGSGNVVPISNGDVVVYTAQWGHPKVTVPDPDLPNRLISYDFNTYFAIPTKQSFVVSDGGGPGYNAPYFKENGISWICSGGWSPYDCAVDDPVVGTSASPNNSFTMTAKWTTYGYQLALGARGDAPLFARSGKFSWPQTNWLFLADNVTPTPWQKVLTVPANHLEYFYVNIWYNSQLTAIPGGGNVGIGTSFPDRRLVIASSGTTSASSGQLQIRRWYPWADAALWITYGTPYVNIWWLENRVNSLQTIAFGYSSLNGTLRYAPAEIGFLTTSVAGNTQGDIVFANRNGTTNVAPTEVMRISSAGNVGIWVTNPTQQLSISRSLQIPLTTGASTGVLYKWASRFMHDYSSSTFTPNIFLGINAGNYTMTQGYNIGIWNNSLTLNTSGYSNIALGAESLKANTTGWNNSAIGAESLEFNTTGWNNVANGFKALYSNVWWGNNTAIGAESLTLNTASSNTAIGYRSLYANTSGPNNVGIGLETLYVNVSGQNNTAIGYQALKSANSPSSNTAIGYQAWLGITTGANNIAIGAGAQVALATASNQLSIGNWLYGSGWYIGIGVAAPTAKLDVAGNFKLGTNGTITTAAGVCTIASTAITTTATAYTCAWVPASTDVAIHCNAATAFTTPNTTSLYCRANWVLSSVTCNTTVANAIATTYKCMWMQ
jgi:hypothetical protein